MTTQLGGLVAVNVAGVELVRLEPSARVLQKEPFALGVIAIEAENLGRKVGATLRAGVTGKAALPAVSLQPSEIVHVFLHRMGSAPELPDVRVPGVGLGVVGGCALFIDGRPSKVALLESRYAYDRPPPRATTQLYCRWLRGGELELGCEMTEFVAVPEGVRAPRLLSRFLEKTSVVSLALI